MVHLEIAVATHFFNVKSLTLQGKGLLAKFLTRLEDSPGPRNTPRKTPHWQRGSPAFKEHKPEIKRYFIEVHAGRLARIHIAYYMEFMTYLQSVGTFRPEHVSVSVVTQTEGKVVPWVVNPTLKPRQVQEDALAFIFDPDEAIDYHPLAPHVGVPRGLHTRLVGIPPGEGKTITALLAAARIGKRLVAVMRNKYIPQWCGEIQAHLGAKPENIVTVNSVDTLVSTAAAIHQGKIDPWAVVISVDTLRSFVGNWENNEEWVSNRYSAFKSPDDAISALAAGLFVYDEAHEMFHSVYRTLLSMNTPMLLGLSATPNSESDFVKVAMARVYPRHKRFTVALKNPTTDLYVVEYTIDSVSRNNLRYENAGMYNHAAFELCIMKHPKLLANYLNMIGDMIDHLYLKTREAESDKALVYVSRIEFGTIVVDYLKKRFPALDVRRVMEDDPHEDALVSDIRVGSTQRLGTGVDMKGLTTVVDTVAVSSENTNIQKMGRLRPIPGRFLKYAFLLCTLIPKHITYANRRVDILRPRARVVKAVRYQKPL